MSKNQELIPEYKYKGIVLKVSDGDSISCLIKLGFFVEIKTKFRLARINAPELKSPDPVSRELARKALDFVVSKIGGREVLINSKGQDKYGRWIAEIYYKEFPVSPYKNISDDLLTEKLAIPYQD